MEQAGDMEIQARREKRACRGNEAIEDRKGSLAKTESPGQLAQKETLAFQGEKDATATTETEESKDRLVKRFS